MSTFFYQGIRINPSVAKIIEVQDQGNRYYIRVFDQNGRWFRIYYLTKDKVKRAPKVGETFTSYEYKSDVVGCDFGLEAQFRSQGLKETL